jgi:hypothetical protein
VFLGDLHVGDSIDLGDFKLSITQEYGPPIVEPINPTTRILLFLQKAKNSPTLWKPTYFEESYFWVQRATDLADSPNSKIARTSRLLGRWRCGLLNTIWSKQQRRQFMHFEICLIEQTFQPSTSF